MNDKDQGAIFNMHSLTATMLQRPQLHANLLKNPKGRAPDAVSEAPVREGAHKASRST